MMQIFKSIIKWIFFRPHFKRFERLGKDVIFQPRVKIVNARKIYIGDRVRIGPSTVIIPLVKYEKYEYSPKIEFGNDVYIGGYCQIHAISKVSIGNGCVLSEYVYISDLSHGMDPKLGLIMKQELHSKGDVIIGESTFIGFGVSILPGVTIGKHCIVGTRSVVTKSFPDYTMIAGSPAKAVKRYDPDLGIWIPLS